MIHGGLKLGLADSVCRRPVRAPGLRRAQPTTSPVGRVPRPGVPQRDILKPKSFPDPVSSRHPVRAPGLGRAQSTTSPLGRVPRPGVPAPSQNGNGSLTLSPDPVSYRRPVRAPCLQRIAQPTTSPVGRVSRPGVPQSAIPKLKSCPDPVSASFWTLVQASRAFTTVPETSVRRKSRPWFRKTSRS